MAEPFRAAPPPQGLTRALRSKRSTLLDGIEDLFASAGEVRSVAAASIRILCDGCGIDLQTKYLNDRKQLYRRYLVHCLEDKVLSEEESFDLKHLLGILHLSDADVAPVHEEVAREVYGKAIAEVLDDMKLDPDEETFLRRLRGDLQISEDVAQKLLQQGEQRMRDRKFSEASTGSMDFVRHLGAAGNFSGSSETSVEEAVADALSQASVVVPGLHWFEVTQIAGYVGEGNRPSWHVTIRAGLKSES
jgi:flavin-binding protein dodecin